VHVLAPAFHALVLVQVEEWARRRILRT